MGEIANILVMCTANRGRSPFTEYLLRKLIDDREWGAGTRIRSAGLCCHELGRGGMEADPKVVELGRKFGLDMSAHQATPMTRDMFEDCDLAIVMEQWQADGLTQSLKPDPGKVVTLRQLGGADGDVTTPDITNASPRGLDLFAAEARRCLEQGLNEGPLADLIAPRPRAE